MQHLGKSYNGLSLLVKLNWDRVLWPTAIAGALMVGNYAASL